MTTTTKKSYDRVYGKIVLEVNDYLSYTVYTYKGKYHRDDGKPAVIGSGAKHWYKDGMRHRVDGPATEYSDGEVAYMIDGLLYDKRSWRREIGWKQRKANKTTI